MHAMLSPAMCSKTGSCGASVQAMDHLPLGLICQIDHNLEAMRPAAKLLCNFSEEDGLSCSSNNSILIWLKCLALGVDVRTSCLNTIDQDDIDWFIIKF